MPLCKIFTGRGATEADAEDWVRADRPDADFCPRAGVLLARGEREEVLRSLPAREKCRERERVPGGLFGSCIKPRAPFPGVYRGCGCLAPLGSCRPAAGTCLDLVVLGTPGACGAWTVLRRAESAPDVVSCLALCGGDGWRG
ncbi:hypothetical protein NDU88_009488 [Pleurodeles waltl]|uniref:Uncharacterized protein n=1 Tax=Pleurodeles waltl TaxID=8319 RepID=A0AAV7QUR6_PLEWA|nr:hypothetical protein NDU88_009488 [Pleurodeles waltl]